MAYICDVSCIVASRILLRKWRIVLPEDGTQVPKHVGESRLRYVLIRSCVFVWHN